MRNLTRTILALALAATATASASFAAAPSANHVTAFNDSQGLIVSVAVSTDTGDQRVKLNLHNHTIPSGSRERIALPVAAGCNVTLKVVYDDGTQVTQPAFDACQTGSVNLRS